ncbi:hypothetical protein OG897_22085 [Streptomyces sp. NBC_00237]|uniref:hypothetical protein n=1 Tax=Streptomyces sp. NBC_00237 TaxID=2975687 RepID=UPI0022575A6F|nr:hypothetical protein [Streptomyces sp. NBC_00237]MCX5204128.1 hypothetical protein [Streptomyces sp. NBC_00237]
MSPHEPPGFLGSAVGSHLGELADASAPWTESRAASAPDLTYELLHHEPGFAVLPSAVLAEVADCLTFIFEHTRFWDLLFVESVAGPSQFSESRTVQAGVSRETAIQLGRTVGLDISAEGDVWLAKTKAELTTEWTKLTNNTVRIDTETQLTRAVEYPVPDGGMDIAMWQLGSRFMRRLILRRGAHLPPDPIPAWAEMALAVPPRLATVPSTVVRTMTRTRESQQ